MPVTADSGRPRIRVEETSRKFGVTFGELCEFVDKAREAGVDESVKIWGDTWISRHAPKDRSGYGIKYIEV